MSVSTGTPSSASVYTTPAFWERLWRTAGIQSVVCFIVAYIVYDHQPQVGASAEALANFYDGDRMRILIAAVFYGLAVLNPMWFERSTTPWRMRDKTVGAGLRRPPVPPSGRFSSCSSRWSRPSRTRSPAREITCSNITLKARVASGLLA